MTSFGADPDWTCMSPAAFTRPGERTGNSLWRRTSHVDEKGKSRISAEDCAVVLVHGLAQPVLERLTVGYWKIAPGCLGGENELVPGFDVELADLPRRKLQHAVDLEADGSQPPWSKAFPGFENAEVFVEGYDVDGKPHPHRMDARRRPNEDARAVVQGRFSEKAEQSREKSVGETNARSDSYGLLRNGDGEILH